MVSRSSRSGEKIKMEGKKGENKEMKTEQTKQGERFQKYRSIMIIFQKVSVF